MSAPLYFSKDLRYRIALIDPQTHAVLTFRDSAGRKRMPEVCVPSNVRFTPQLLNAIHATWGLRAIVIDYLPPDVTGIPCAVVELLSKRTTESLYPTDVDEIHDDDLPSTQRVPLLTILSGQAEGPFACLGWLGEAIRWVEETSGSRISSIEDIEQLNAGGHFTLLRFPTANGQSYWLKAAGPLNPHEMTITRLLSALCPEHIPEVLDTKSEWNAWIMRHRDSLPFPVDPEQRFIVLKSAVTAMAEIQLHSVGQEKELLEAGAFDQRLDVLLTDSASLIEAVEEIMSLQTSARVPRIERRGLRKLQERFLATCEHLRTLPIPNTVLHGDTNEGNILWGDQRCWFIDWSESRIGHPLIALQHLLLLNCPETEQAKSRWDRDLIEQYRTSMAEAFDSTAFDEALICAPLIAAASALYARGTWLRSPISEIQYRYARIRALTRYMNRASEDPALLRLTGCPLASISSDCEEAVCSR